MKLNLNNISLVMSAGRKDQFPTDGKPEIIFSGRSNVGKSSLINTLLGRKSLARVSSTPGKTITINFYDIDGKIYFVDLPGYGYAARRPDDKQVWSALTDAYLNAMREVPRMVIQLIDAKAGPSRDDMAMIDWLEATGTPCVLVATKIDKLNKTDRAAAIAGMESKGASVIPFSSLNGEGCDKLWREIYDAL